MLQISQLRLPVGHSRIDLERKIASVLRCSTEDFHFEILRKSLDARHKDNLRYVYTIDVSVRDEARLIRRLKNRQVISYTPCVYTFPTVTEPAVFGKCRSPLIIGSGPAGLFAAWYLARAGLKPVILERGEPVEQRIEAVNRFWEKGILLPDSNVQFGEGGAGTFSDGKLNTQIRDPSGRNREVLRRFVAAGAPEDILYEQKPHLGTDLLVRIVCRLREEILEMGGSIRFQTRVDDLLTEELPDRRVIGVVTQTGEQIPCDACILAVGHSARDTFSMLAARGVPMQSKAFAIGVRIEHPQKLINLSQYGSENDPRLGAASYKLTHTSFNGRGVYSFCMCPGGYVVNASSEIERLCINGMSYHGRAGVNANSALIVTVTPEDYPEPGPMGGIAFQRRLEEAAWRIAGGRIPVQLYADFCQNRASSGLGDILPQTKGEYALANVRSLLPPAVSLSLQEGMQAFGRKIHDFDRPDAVLSGIESRTSSPLRILRDPLTLQSPLSGLYPCGEGAGYAGGITSAAMDGMKAAEAVVRALQ